ncbi:protein obstructor-E [Bactrocera dorsalis]|uniref:Peritrophin-1 n=1 Tax=Bactrocera dorsalis TaxID=27457 RepID=A0A034WUX0_BACDO|nr:protein obstructor-E [Bactrocera dorsalis]
MAFLKICIFAIVVGTALAQRNNFRKGAGHPASQRHLPKRPTDPPPTEEGYEPTDECPEANGFFPDLEQCDKYYSCYEGKPTERLCADGMVFNDYSPLEEKCDLPYNIDCSKRSKLQTPQPSQHCPRKNGYFGHEEKGVCDKFYYCVDGQFNMITCPQGLVFNPKTGICTWPDEVGVKGCNSQDIFEFECPKVNESVAVTHPRYADPDDCQFFYVCVNGEIPRRNGCKLGQVFDEEKKHCDWSRNVPECADWYKDRLTDAELEELENPKPKTKKPQRTRGPSRRKPAKAAHVEEEVEEE